MMNYTIISKKSALSLLLILTLLFLTACGGGKQEELTENSVKIYCTDTGETGLFWENRELTANTEPERIAELIECLSQAPDNSLYIKVMPDSLKILSYYFGADGQLVVDFDSSYSSLPVIEELLFRSGFVKTLCQLDSISYVEFYVNGQPLMLRSDTPVGQMSDLSFVDNTGQDSKFRQKVNLTVYFADDSGRLMSESMLVVENSGVKTMEELVLEQLINGPIEAMTDLQPVISAQTVVNKVSTRDGICYVDFNESFLEGPEQVSSDISVYAVVNSLAELSNVAKVKITVNGEEKKSFGDTAISGVLERRPELIKAERAGEASD